MYIYQKSERFSLLHNPICFC